MSGKQKDTPDSLFGEIQHPKKRAFLAAFAQTGNKTRAAEAAGIDRSTIYTPDWINDKEFQKAVDRAEYMAADLLEEEARRRAIEGVQEPVGWFQGVAGGTVQRYSDTLLMFLAKGIKPEKYRERHELTGKDGKDLAPSVVILPAKSSNDG